MLSYLVRDSWDSALCFLADFAGASDRVSVRWNRVAGSWELLVF